MLALGIACAFVGNAVIGLGNVLQKYALARATKPPDRPGLHLPKSVDETQTPVQQLKLAMARRIDSFLRSGYSGDPTKAYSRFRDRLWWTGFLATYAGEVGGNWVALSVASPTVVTPLGIVGVIANIIFANLLLGEQVSKRHRVG
jgi:drug/metabolite transporter (DMT)-like permease